MESESVSCRWLNKQSAFDQYFAAMLLYADRTCLLTYPTSLQSSMLQQHGHDRKHIDLYVSQQPSVSFLCRVSRTSTSWTKISFSDGTQL